MIDYKGEVKLNGVIVPCKRRLIGAMGMITVIDDFKGKVPPDNLRDIITIIDDSEEGGYVMGSPKEFHEQYMQKPLTLGVIEKPIPGIDFLYA